MGGELLLKRFVMAGTITEGGYCYLAAQHSPSRVLSDAKYPTAVATSPRREEQFMYGVGCARLTLRLSKYRYSGSHIAFASSAANFSYCRVLTRPTTAVESVWSDTMLGERGCQNSDRAPESVHTWVAFPWTTLGV